MEKIDKKGHAPSMVSFHMLWEGVIDITLDHLSTEVELCFEQVDLGQGLLTLSPHLENYEVDSSRYFATFWHVCAAGEEDKPYATDGQISTMPLITLADGTVTRFHIQLIFTSYDPAHKSGLLEDYLDLLVDEFDLISGKKHISRSLLFKEVTRFDEKSSVPQAKGGRPRNPANVWALEQVRIKHRPAREVFIEWKERFGPQVSLLADPAESFRKAINPSRRKKPEK